LNTGESRDKVLVPMSQGAGQSGVPGQIQVPDASPVPAAVRTAMAQIADEVSRAMRGPVRELTLTVDAGNLGRVAVRLAQTGTGAVRVELAAETVQAARSLQRGLTDLAQALERREVAVEIPPVAVGTAADFTGSNRSRPQPRWFEHLGVTGQPRRPGGLQIAGGAHAAYARWDAMVDLLA